MFAKIFALFALVAMAFAAPKPEPSPQFLAYTGLDYTYPAVAAVPSVVSPYTAPIAYSAYPATYGGAYFIRR